MKEKITAVFFGSDEGWPSRPQNDPIDNKIQILALKQMPAFSSTDQPLSSIIKLLSNSFLQTALENSHRWKIGRKEKEPLVFRRKLIKKRLPIGLRHNQYAHWLNAFMQFVIFVPALRSLFDYTPKSFFYFNLFIDQYLQEQQEGKAFCSFDSLLLLDSLASFFQRSFYFCEGVFNFLGLLIEVRKSANFFKKDLVEIEMDKMELEESLKQGMPLEILAAQTMSFNKKNKPKKQLAFADCFYELDAFIECREDVMGKNSYFAYLKHEGVWYQCDDLRIVEMRSDYLQTALNRSLLLHYKRIELGFVRKRV